MSSNSEPISDPMWGRYYHDMDFADAKPVAQVPALSRLDVEQGGATDATVQVERRVLAAFKAQAELTEAPCEALMGEVFRQLVEGRTPADVVRERICEALQSR